MEKLYVIVAVFRLHSAEFNLFWLPSAHCFTFETPRSIIPKGEVHFNLTEAESHARLTLGGTGMKTAFTLRAVEVDMMGGQVKAAAAAGKEWLPV